MTNYKNFYDLEILKKHIAEDKNVNYLELLNYSSPVKKKLKKMNYIKIHTN